MEEPTERIPRFLKAFFLACSFAAFVLSVLTFCAGSTTAFLPQCQLFQVNLHQLGVPINSTMTGHQKTDFYNIYPWNVCSGEYDPPQEFGTNSFSNVNHCWSWDPDYNYNVMDIVRDFFSPPLDLDDLVMTAQVAHMLYVTFLGGVVAASMEVIASVFSLVSKKDVIWNHIFFTTIGSCLLLISSSIGTYLANRAVDTINQSVPNPNPQEGSTVGRLWLGLTWGGFSVLAFLALVYDSLEVVRVIRDRRAAKEAAAVATEAPVAPVV